MPLGPVEIPHVFEVRFPTVSMPSANVGQLNFSANGENYSFLMPRQDLARLNRKIAQLLAEEPQPAQWPE
jgi:hypothetical protein